MQRLHERGRLGVSADDALCFSRTYVGGRTTLLDVAKSAVETFVKIRQRSPESRIDRWVTNDKVFCQFLNKKFLIIHPKQ